MLWPMREMRLQYVYCQSIKFDVNSSLSLVRTSTFSRDVVWCGVVDFYSQNSPQYHTWLVYCHRCPLLASIHISASSRRTYMYLPIADTVLFNTSKSLDDSAFNWEFYLTRFISRALERWFRSRPMKEMGLAKRIETLLIESGFHIIKSGQLGSLIQILGFALIGAD